MNPRTIRLAALFAAALSAAAAAEPPAGRLLAAQCAQCHGTNGHSSSGIEGLAGESARELLEELLEMKRSGSNDLMVAHALGYSDQELQLIAQYLANQAGSDGSSQDGNHDD